VGFSLSLVVPLAFALVCSVLSDRGLIAVVVALTVFMLMQILGNVPAFAPIRPWLFTTPMSFWNGIFTREPDWAQIARDMAWSLAYVVTFVGVALVVFRNRDIGK
jgi:hypothetical protein